MNTRLMRSIRNRKVHKQGGLCAYCNEPMDPADGVSPRSATLDHVKPVSAGGTNDWWNLVACCFACNQAKADEVVPKLSRKISARRRHRKPPKVDPAAEAREHRKMAQRRALS